MNKPALTVIAAMLLTMAAFTVAGPASADTDCPKDGWSRTDGSQGSVTGEFGLITWYGTEVWWDIEEGYKVSICAQTTETVAWTVTGPEKEAAQVSEQDVTSLSYIVKRETVTQHIPVKPVGGVQAGEANPGLAVNTDVDSRTTNTGLVAGGLLALLASALVVAVRRR